MVREDERNGWVTVCGAPPWGGRAGSASGIDCTTGLVVPPTGVGVVVVIRPRRLGCRLAGVIVGALLLVSGCTATGTASSTVPGTPNGSTPTTASRAALAADKTAPSVARVDVSSGEVSDSLAQGVTQFLHGWDFGPLVRAVLVQVNGKTVLERYAGTTAAQSRSVASVTKSVVSTLVGIALAEHRIRGLDERLDQLLPKFADLMRPEVAAITLRQLLTMTAGLPDTWDADPAFLAAPDWIREILRQGNDQQPGRSFAYADAGPHLLSAVLVQATGQPVLAYARDKLFDPLGIDTTGAAQPVASPANIAVYNKASTAWPVDPQGFQTGFNLLKLTPGELLKLGQLFLDHGRWRGRQVVPASWVRDATTGQVPTDVLTPGARYGYLWWVLTVDGDPAYAAVGYGGQLIEVVPRRGLVVVVSSDYALLPNTGSPITVDDLALLEMVATVIAPAVSGR